MLKYTRRFTREQKSVILLEHLEGGVSISELSRKYQVSPHTIYIWRRAMKKREEDVVSLEPSELLSEIDHSLPSLYRKVATFWGAQTHPKREKVLKNLILIYILFYSCHFTEITMKYIYHEKNVRHQWQVQKEAENAYFSLKQCVNGSVGLPCSDPVSS